MSLESDVTYTAAPANGAEPSLRSTTRRLMSSGTPVATPDALPTLVVMSLRTMPLMLSAFTPFEPSPGNRAGGLLRNRRGGSGGAD